MIPCKSPLQSNFNSYVFLLLFSFSIFSDRRSLKIENINNSTKYMIAEDSDVGQESIEFSLLIQKHTLAGWNYLWLGPIFLVPSLFEPLRLYYIYFFLFNKPDNFEFRGKHLNDNRGTILQAHSLYISLRNEGQMFFAFSLYHYTLYRGCHCS